MNERRREEGFKTGFDRSSTGSFYRGIYRQGVGAISSVRKFFGYIYVWLLITLFCGGSWWVFYLIVRKIIERR